MDGTTDPSVCPLCGRDNGCGNLGSDAPDTQCWCMEQVIDPDLLHRLADSVPNTTCICQTCALKHGQPDNSSRSD